MNSLSIITAHFHDFRWTELLLHRLREMTPADSIREILIIDQDRTALSCARLSAMDSRVRVVQYPRNERLFKILGHDHPAVLNRAVQEAQGEWICLFDSDAHPISADWLSSCAGLLENYDAILAEDSGRPGLSHPCFMLWPRRPAALPLSFDEGLYEMPLLPGRVAEKNDTGRMIARQLAEAGQRIFLASATSAFEGYWGDIYLDCIYHHGSGSFKGAGALLTSQLTWQHEFFEHQVLNRGVYKLAGLRRGAYQIKISGWNLRNKCLTALQMGRRSLLGTTSPN